MPPDAKTGRPLDLNRAQTVAALAGILAIGLLLRLYRIGAESAWWDEYASLMHLGAPDLWAFLKLSHTLDPATLPLYFSIEYFWAHYVNGSVTGLRWLSICIGMSSIPILYLLGRTLYGRTAGLAAALCMALSPIHIFHAQGIRMYVLMTLLALISVYTYVNVLQDGRPRWWTLHVLANLLLLWTHPFAMLVIAVEAASMLLFHHRAIKRLALWIGLHVLAASPSIIYLLNIRFWAANTTDTWLKLPSPAGVLADLVADDVVSWTYQLRVSEAAWAWLPAPLARAAVGLHPFLDALLLAAFLGAMALTFRNAIEARRDNAAPASPSRFETACLLALWLCLPVLALYGMSLAWRPCIFPRYTLHCSLALYVMIGGAIASLRPARTQLLAVAVLAGLYAYQLSLVLPGPQRTDWKSAARVIEANSRPDDFILVQVSIWKDVFLYNMGTSTHPVSSAKTLDTLADQAGFLLGIRAEPGDSSNRERTVWAVIVLPYFDSGPSKKFEDLLASHDLAFSITELGGIEHLLVYHISKTKSEGPPPIPTNRPPDFVDSYGSLILALADQSEFKLAEAVAQRMRDADSSCERIYGRLFAAIRKQQDVMRFADAVCALRKGYGYQENGQLDFAIQEFRRATECDPELYIAFGRLGWMLAEKGGYDAALKALRTAIEADPEEALLYLHLMHVLGEKGNVKAAVDSLHKVLEGIALFDPGNIGPAESIMKTAAELDPHFALPHVILALAAVTSGNTAACMPPLRQAFRIDPEGIGQWEPFFVALLETKDYAAARAELEKLRARKIYLPHEFVDMLDNHP